MPYVFGDLGAAPCPPPEGCPPGKQRNPNYPEHSATCCKPIPGYIAPPVVGPVGPEGPASGPADPHEAMRMLNQQMRASATPWYEKLGYYKWYILGGSAALVAVVTAAVLLRKSPAPATADWEW